MADMGVVEKVVAVLGALGIGSIATYLGTRYSAKKSAEPAMALVQVEGRRVTLEEIQIILDAHEKELIRLNKKLEDTERALKTSRTFLKLALAHIGFLRRDMRAAGVEPPALPVELSSDNIPWDVNMFD